MAQPLSTATNKKESNQSQRLIFRQQSPKILVRRPRFPRSVFGSRCETRRRGGGSWVQKSLELFHCAPNVCDQLRFWIGRISEQKRAETFIVFSKSNRQDRQLTFKRNRFCCLLVFLCHCGNVFIFLKKYIKKTSSRWKKNCHVPQANKRNCWF